MPFIEPNTRLVANSDDLGLKCTPEGLTLAGIPLLRRTVTGWIPRSTGEIGAVTRALYGQIVDPAKLKPGLDVVAKALNNGDLGRAMVAVVHLRLPRLDSLRAIFPEETEGSLAKYNPAEPRDSRGRWTTGVGATASNNASPAYDRPDHGAPAPILVANVRPRASNDNAKNIKSSIVCNIAARLCQQMAMAAGETYFDACWVAQDLCDKTLIESQVDLDNSFVITFPDGTAVEIYDGDAWITHRHGVKLLHPRSNL